MKYVTTLGAYGLAVAAAFAVALAVLVSVSSTAEAVEPGKSADVTASVTTPSGGTGVARIEIDALSTASGSFDFNDGQTIVCNDGGKCDTDAVDGTNTADSVTVKLNIDADSADGFILLKVTDVLAASPTVTYQSVDVTTLPQPASLTAKAVSTTIDANGAVAAIGNAGRTEIVATVKNNQSPSVGMNDQRLTFVTTLGVMDCPESGTGNTAIAAATNVQWCQVWTSSSNSDGETAADGNAVISLKASGREGTAIVTISHATLDPTTVDVKLFGTAKDMTAEAEQGSVEVGGSVFVVLTVTDAAGNPVKNVQPQPAGTDPIAGPADDSNKVTTSQAADDGVATTSPYNVNKDVDGDGVVDKGDIPACGPVTAVTAGDQSGDPPTPPLAFASTGTNDAGQCVVQVKATPDDDTTPATNESSTRGVHTLNFALDDIEASVEITVAGAAASIESDAPEYVEALSDTTITVTVSDDEGVLVGDTSINVIKVAGDGLAEGAATKEGARTKNGSATFSYAAGLEGQVVFRVIAGTGSAAIRDIITLTVGFPDMECPDGTSVAYGETCADVECPDGTSVGNGESCPDVECPDGTSVGNGESCPDVECPDGTSVGNGESCPDVECPDGTSVANGETCPEPEAPEEATLTVQGNLGSFSGGSLDDFAAAANAACPGGSQIAVQDAGGAWQLWSSTAPAFVNIGFTTAFADGFDGATLVWVTSCEADAMESEGSMEEGSMAEGSMEENGG